MGLSHRAETAHEYDRYMEHLVEKLNKLSVSIMSIAEECGCKAYQHIGNGYKINIVKHEDSQEV